MRLPLLVAPAALLLLAATPGCHSFHQAAAPSVPRAMPKPLVAVSQSLPIDLLKVQPNEAGMIPILEYHDLVIGTKPKGLQIPASEFRSDLEWLYAHNYIPISLSDYVKGRIDCPAGKSPVILTFDDALKGQFNYTNDGKIDPNCVVGILDAFHALHADWPLKGTFFVLTDGDPKMPPSFYQAGLAQGKLEYLVKEGFEIGNHTVHHRMGIKHWSDAQVQAEFAGAVTNIQRLLPGYNVETLALPYGIYPKNQKLVISGSSGGVQYHNICALLAGANPAPSPFARNFKPYRLPRIIPGNMRYAMKYWLTELEKNKTEKFISDGDSHTYTVNIIASGQLDKDRLQKAGYLLRPYTGTQVIATVK